MEISHNNLSYRVLQDTLFGGSVQGASPNNLSFKFEAYDSLLIVSLQVIVLQKPDALSVNVLEPSKTGLFPFPDSKLAKAAQSSTNNTFARACETPNKVAPFVVSLRSIGVR